MESAFGVLHELRRNQIKTYSTTIKKLGEALSEELEHDINDFFDSLEYKNYNKTRTFHVTSQTVLATYEDEEYDQEESSISYGLFYDYDANRWVMINEIEMDSLEDSEKTPKKKNNKKSRIFEYTISKEDFRVNLKKKSFKEEIKKVTLYEFGTVVQYIYRFEAIKKYQEKVDPVIFSCVFENKSLPPGQGSFYKAFSHEKSLPELNPKQLSVVMNVNESVELVHGPPGTGKSYTIVNFLQNRIQHDKKVLIVTTTNKAIDSLTSKIVAKGEGDKILAIGRNVEESSQKFLLENQVNQSKFITSMKESYRDLKYFKENISSLSNEKKNQIQNKITSRFTHCDEWDRLDLKIDLPSYILMIQNVHRDQKWLNLAFEFQYLALKTAITKEVERIYEKTRFVVCTASTSVKLERRISSFYYDIEGQKCEITSECFKIDHLIVDEAASVHPLDLLGSLLCGAQSVLMVGDHHQLPPMVNNKIKDEGYRKSCMEQLVLQKTVKIHQLVEQYRMPLSVCNVVSSVFYEGQLITRKASQWNYPTLRYQKVDGWEVEEEGSYFNNEEIGAIFNCIEWYQKKNVSLSDICVITFYSKQKHMLLKRAKRRGLNDLKVKTVDSMQGREENHVIVSFVRTDEPGFLNKKRINVSISRSLQSLTVIASPRLKKFRVLRKVFESIEDEIDRSRELLLYS